MQRQFFSGNSLDQAVMAAARQFQLEPDQLAYKVRDKKHGFLNARRKVVIEVDPQAPQLPEKPVAALASPPAPAMGPVAPRIAVAPPTFDQDDEEDDSYGPGNEATPVVSEDRGGRPSHPPWGNPGRERSAQAAPRVSQDRGGRDQRPPRNDGGVSRGERRGSIGRQGQGVGRSEGRSDGRSNSRPGSSGYSDGRRGAPAHANGRHQDGGRRRQNGHGRPDGEKAKRVIIRSVEHRWREGNWLQADAENEGVSREVLAFERGIELVLDVVDIDIEFAVTEGDPFKIEFSGEDREILVAEDGQILKAIEHILPRLVRSAVGEALTCRVDCEDFQAAHEESLMTLAKNVANEVKQNMRAKALPPMNPADRRIVHVALMEDPDVDTLSEGDGYIKRVKILPVRR
jgi:predicted RNA-binding protein Jag